MEKISTVPETTVALISQKSAVQPWLVIFSAALFFFYIFLQICMFNSLGQSLAASFHIGTRQISQMAASYFYANVIFLFPAGLILDRVSTRRVLLVVMGIAVLCTVGFALAQTVWQATLFHLITGLVGAFSLISSIRLASRWFAPERMAQVIGLVVTFAMLGGMTAQTPFTILVDHIGWRDVLWVDVVVGVLIWLIIAKFVKDAPPGYEKQTQAEHEQLASLGFWKTVSRTVFNLQNWLGGLYTSMMNLPIFLLGASWGVLYLVQIRHLSREDASIVSMALFIGMTIGSPLLGWLSDRIRQRKPAMIVAAILALITMLWLMYAPHLSFSALILVYFCLGFLSGAQIISYPLVAESNPASLTGSSEGMASILIMSGGFTIPLFATLINWQNDHSLVQHILHYSLSDFRLGLSIMPIAFALSIIAAFVVKETFCKRIEN